MDLFMQAILDSFIALFIILDPFLGLAVFSTITKGMNSKERAEQAFVAAAVAFGLLVIFMFGGLYVLNLLGIDFASFKVGGGILLLILGIQAVLGIEFAKKKQNTKAAAVIIGTPLLCGPGAMTAITVLSEKYSYLPPLIASIIAVYITWVMLVYSDKITKLLGDRSIEIISRVMGLILAALAIQFIKDGVVVMINSAA
jgi:multiple antibiotic resistance protein